VYALTELAHGYGFLAVFIAAITIRSTERTHEYHEQLHEFAEQIERTLMMVLLVLLGGAIVHGLLSPLDYQGVVFAAIAILVIRPVSGWLGLLGGRQPLGERAVIAIYGIRGLGSAYYLAYASAKEPFADPDYIWAVVGLVIVMSIVLHGVTVTPVMRRLDRS
jgi:NhaP-type Na+/H+ or K+/H+ antiporter